MILLLYDDNDDKLQDGTSDLCSEESDLLDSKSGLRMETFSSTIKMYQNNFFFDFKYANWHISFVEKCIIKMSFEDLVSID